MTIRPLSKDRIRILFVRPPCHLWPIINESDNFLMPLSFPSLAAYIKRKTINVDVRIIDCLPLKIGFNKLSKMMADIRPDIVGVGDSLPYVHEGIKVLEMAKAMDPRVVTVAGGHFHSHMPVYSLTRYSQIDVIVRYEGETAFVDLINAFRSGADLSRVPSLAFRDNGEIVETPPAPLIEDLDTLPIPDYEAMPVSRYAPFGKLWPRAATIQSSRGCPMDCEYCSWSALEGEHRWVDGRIGFRPKRRSKSVERTLEEIDFLYRRFGARYLFWVDGTWNFDTAWLDRLCDGIQKRGYKLGWWAFVRADLLLEQERSGVLEKMVRAGFSHTLFGGERFVPSEMTAIGKLGMDGSEVTKASQLLKQKYPSVFRQATFVTGIRSETRESMADLGRQSRQTGLDFAAFHPLMPYPGTPLWEKALREEWIEEFDFSKYDMFHPVMPSETLSREEIARLTKTLYLDFVGKQPLAYLRGLFSSVPIRRKLHRWFLFSIGRVVLIDLIRAIKGEKKFEGFAAMNQLQKPIWYDD